MAKEDVIKTFTALKGVGDAKAEALYDAGYTSLEKLSKASVEDLSKIKGITENAAETILKQTQQSKPKTESKPKAAQPKKPKDDKEPKKAAEPEKKAEEKTPKQDTKKAAEPKTPKEEKQIKEKAEKKSGTPKIKPKLSEETRHQLQIRKEIDARTPRFLREEWFRYKRVPKNWRRPDGITSKMRINLKYRPSKVRVGFRKPKSVRGLHASGFEEVMVYNVNDLESINPDTQAARIGGTVGMKKRLAIAKKAEEKNIRILNMRV